VTDTENEITADLIAELLRDQHPDLADLPLTFGARGWDNQLWRLGEDLAVRLPWATQDADELLLKEHTLLPAIAPRLPLQIPVPQRAGRNRQGGPLADSGKGFAHFLKEATDRGLISDPDAVREVWDDALAAPDWTGPTLWLHGDLHPANLLTSDGNFCGVVDFGDMCAGDPACGLAACWILLPDGVIDRLHQSYSSAVDAATLRRTRGWALSKAVACVLIGDAGVHGRPGGKATWGPPADAALQRLTATRPTQRPSDQWMAITDRLRLRLLRAEDAVPLREVVEDGWVEALAARTGDRTLSPWVIVMRGGGAIVGFCGFFVRPVKGTTMGYAIVPQYRPGPRIRHRGGCGRPGLG
jgi:aminoglycoside phosphotransferase (APT) family kinase protein